MKKLCGNESVYTAAARTWTAYAFGFQPGSLHWAAGACAEVGFVRVARQRDACPGRRLGFDLVAADTADLYGGACGGFGRNKSGRCVAAYIHSSGCACVYLNVGAGDARHCHRAGGWHLNLNLAAGGFERSGYGDDRCGCRLEISDCRRVNGHSDIRQAFDRALETVFAPDFEFVARHFHRQILLQLLGCCYGNRCAARRSVHHFDGGAALYWCYVGGVDSVFDLRRGGKAHSACPDCYYSWKNDFFHVVKFVLWRFYS